MKTITTKILAPSREWMNQFYQQITSMTKKILKVYRGAIADTARSSKSDYLRPMLLDEFGAEFSWELIDGYLMFHQQRGKSPFLQNKLWQQNKLRFPIPLHRKAIRDIRQISSKKFLIKLRIFPEKKGRDVFFIVATSEKHGTLLASLIEKGIMPRNPIIKRTTRRRKDILILTLEEELVLQVPSLFCGIDMNVDSVDLAIVDKTGAIQSLWKIPTNFRAFFMDWYRKWNRLKRINGRHTSRQMKRLLRARSHKKRRILNAVIHGIRFLCNGDTPQIRIERLDFVRMKMIPEFPHWVKRSFMYGGELKQLLSNNWQVEEIKPKNTSRTCSNCAHVHSSRENQHIFSCENCGLVMDSHLNAAIVIAAGGVKAFQLLKGKHGMTRNVPPPSSSLPERGRGLVNEKDKISRDRQLLLDEYLKGNNFASHSETGKKQSTEVAIEAK